MVSKWVEVSNHAAEVWKQRRPNDCRLGPRAAWDESVLVPEELWRGEVYSREVWAHPETLMLIVVDRNEAPTDWDMFIKTAYDLGGSAWQEPIIEWLREKYADRVPVSRD